MRARNLVPIVLPAIWIAVAVVCPTRGLAAQQEVVVIAHMSVATDSLALADLRLMYLGKKSRWPNDTAVQPAVMKSGPVHKAFVADLLQRTPSKFSSYWKQIVFTGKGVPPRAFSEEADLLAYVRETPGAIGYLTADMSPEGVRMLVLQ